MIELVASVVEQQSSKVLVLLQLTEEVLISTVNCCVKITAENSKTVDELVNKNEEADTKVVLNCMHVLKRQLGNVIVRFPSGDTDIIAIMIRKPIEKK